MNKRCFLRGLSRRLRSISREEREASLAYYTEMIQDRMEFGMTEEQAVAQLGSVDEIAAGILADVTGEPVRGKNYRGWLIALGIIGSPVWLPIALAVLAVAAAAAVVLLSGYAAIWAVTAGLYAADFALVLCGPVGLLGMVGGFVKGNPSQALFFLAAGFVLSGLALMLLPMLNLGCAGLVRFTKWSVRAGRNTSGRRRG